MAELQVTREKLESIQRKLTQYLLDAGYEGTLEDGTGAYDIVVKGNALITMYLNEQYEKTRGYLSLQEAERFRDVLGSEYDDAVDSILSNWFVSRKEGIEARVILRLWFSRPLQYIKFSEGDELATIDGQTYKVLRDYTFSNADFTSLLKTDKYLEEFYVDIELVAVNKMEQAVDKSSSVKVDISEPYYLRSEVNEVISFGDAPETSEDFIERTQHVITTRELITYKALYTVLQEEFREIDKLYIAGHGSPEQKRDLKSFDKVDVHVGNKADIFVNGNNIMREEIYTVPSNNTIQLNNQPVTHIFEVSSVETGDQINYSLSVSARDNYLVSSPESRVSIIVDETFNNQDIIVKYLSSTLANSVHEYVTSELNRVVCYSPVVKAFYPVVINVNLFVLMSEGAKLEDYSDKIKEEIKKFILKLQHKEPITESRLHDHLHQNIPMISRIATPIDMSYKFMDPVSLEYKSNTFNDYLIVENIPEVSDVVTSNTVEFYTHNDFINIHELETEQFLQSGYVRPRYVG